MRILAVLLLATAAGLSGAWAAPADGRGDTAKIDTAKIDAALKGFIQSKALVGVSALVYQDGREAYFGAFGQADREAGKPMTRGTLVQIFSMTKPITGVALMTLYEEGKFQLDEPLAKYAPEFADLRVYGGIDAQGQVIYLPLSRPVTLRDITRHTAGFYGGTDHTPVAEIYRAADPANKMNTLTEEARKLALAPLLFQPGTRWLYGPSVDVQALLVERLSGMPFDRYLEQKIFKPLRMKDTRYVLQPEDRARMAAMYDWHEDGSMSREPDQIALAFNGRDWPLKPGSARPRSCKTPVNIVNAQFVAKERGITMSETVTEEAHRFKNLITIKVKTDKTEETICRDSVREGPQPDSLGRQVPTINLIPQGYVIVYRDLAGRG